MLVLLSIFKMKTRLLPTYTFPPEHCPAKPSSTNDGTECRLVTDAPACTCNAVENIGPR